MKKFYLAAAVALALATTTLANGHLGFGRSFGFRSYAFGYPVASAVVPGASFVPSYGYAATFASPFAAPAVSYATGGCGGTAVSSGVPYSAPLATPALAPVTTGCSCATAAPPVSTYSAPLAAPGVSYDAGVSYSSGVGYGTSVGYAAPLVFRSPVVYRSAFYGGRFFAPAYGVGRAFGTGFRTFGRAVFGPRVNVAVGPRVVRSPVVVRAPGVRVRVGR